MPNTPAKNFSAATASLQRAASDRDVDSANHLRWVQTQIEAIERGQFQSVMFDAHDDVEFDIFAPPQFPFISKARGKSELLAAVTHNFGALDDQTPEIRDIFADGDTVVLFGRERGKVRQTGAVYDVEFVERFAFRDGRLASLRIVVADAAAR